MPTEVTCLIMQALLVFFPPCLILYSHTAVSWDHLPNKLKTESLLPSLLLGEARPRHCPAPLGLQELLCNSQRLYPKGAGTSHTGRVPSVPTKADTYHLTARFCTSPFLSSRSLSSIFTTLRSLSSSSWMESFCSSDIRSLVAMNLSREGRGLLSSSWAPGNWAVS